MYYYHAICILGQHYSDVTYTHYWTSFTHDEMTSQIVIPFLRKDAVMCSGPAILNLGQGQYLEVYRTRKPLNDEQVEAVKNNRPVGANCTERLFREIEARGDDVHPRSMRSGLLTTRIRRNQLFVVMKFDDPYLDSAYRGVIRPVAEHHGYHVLRVDEIEDSGSVTDQVLTSLMESAVVLVDLSGERPNCYYEAGIAHALGKEMILAVRQGEPVHFDLADYRFIKWETEQELREQLERRMKSMSVRRSGRHAIRRHRTAKPG